MSIEKMQIPLNPNDWHGFSYETLFVSKAGNGLYKVENTPFFARGVHYLDLVEARPAKKALMFKGVSKRSGYSTYRIIVETTACENEFAAEWEKLRQMGCTCEDLEGELPLFSVMVPPSCDLPQVEAILIEAEDMGIWSFEKA
ncbi:DUF4265 domain-containing protein [Polycladidibacter stylochi]|uniref:DUF4265 domain-containing protein n=1 Tax=Polycladidibacter stylochi TaxID=1807766 RepID=UPI0008362B48|nr:DUF4265 domain-containing protein [Pseudovibrio stylochi]